MTDTLDTLRWAADTYKTHNGCITIRNKATGEHRTFQIKTQAEDSNFAPGERIMALLTGPENESDYRGFAFVKADGRVILWKKSRTPVYEAFVAALTRPDLYEDRYDYLFEGRCRVCNRKLTNPESIDSGIGPECAKHVHAPRAIARPYFITGV